MEGGRRKPYFKFFENMANPKHALVAKPGSSRAQLTHLLPAARGGRRFVI